jgi:nitroreductase
MKFTKSISEIIKKRKSIRSYIKDRAIEEDKIEIIEKSINELNSGNIRFKLVKVNSSGKRVKIGTYGIISGANYFLVGIMKNIDKNETLEFGKKFERLILKATDLDLGTCWLVGTFNRNDFAKHIELEDGEKIVMASPLGYGVEKDGFKEIFIKFIVKPHKRKKFSELFFKDKLNNILEEEDIIEYKNALEMLKLAPSAKNVQPWRVIKTENSYDFYLESKSSYVYKGINCGYNDLGIAMEHFELVANEENLSEKWQNLDKSDLENSKYEYIKSWKI